MKNLIKLRLHTKENVQNLMRDYYCVRKYFGILKGY